MNNCNSIIEHNSIEAPFFVTPVSVGILPFYLLNKSEISKSLRYYMLDHAKA